MNVLLLEDSENDARLILHELQRGGWTISHLRVDTAAAMEAALATRSWDLIIADYTMPQFSGTEALALARSRMGDVPFILISGSVGEETAVSAMRAGANDYLLKGDLSRLVPAVERELRESSAKRQAQSTRAQLHNRESQLAEAMRLAKLGTWHFDIAENITNWSDEGCRIIGRTESPSMQQFLDCIHVDDRPHVIAAIETSGVSQIALDCRIACSKAPASFVHIRGEFVRNSQGVATSARGMIQDISERMAFDAELHRLKDAAEAANRSKSDFLANMSHEIRTPMTAIVGFADMMLRRGREAPDHEECVHVIRRNAWHLLELINEILDLSKIEAGQMTVEKRRCDLPELLSEINSLMRSRAEEKSLRFNVAFDGQLPRYIYTDSLRLRQILVNLLGNAVKFTTVGSVEVSVRCEKTGSTQEQGQPPSSILRIRVRDTGIGMTAEQLSRLFEPFMQGEQSITRKFGGTGLGLTISRRLARLLGGDVAVTSQFGLGSTFEFWIDSGTIDDSEFIAGIADARPTEEADDSDEDAMLRDATILLAEDGRDNQRLLTAHLEMAGAKVVVAENGQIALQLSSQTHFDVILMDMQMPVMDGYTATAELRRRGTKTPIIALTAYAMSDDRAKCMASGCNDYHTKPVDSDLLLEAICNHLNRHRPNFSKAIEAADTTRSLRAPVMYEHAME